MLQPLTFNLYLFILQRTLVTARSTLATYLLIVVIVIAAFGAYLFLTVGSNVSHFRDMVTSSLALLQLLLAMISFRGNLKMESMQAQIVVALYALVMTLVMVNLFITALTMTFDQIKKIQRSGETVDEYLIFNEELNCHFWLRLKSIAAYVVRRCLPERKYKNQVICIYYR